MADPISLIISGVSLLISGTTAWLTLLRKGRVRMTRPTIVCFAREASAEHAEVTPKVFLRALLYTTAKRGLVVENLFLKLQRGEATQTFSIWAYGDTGLVRGSGLFVGAEGVACNHHFLPPSDGGTFEFLPGDYVLQVYASIVGRSRPVLLTEVRLLLSEPQAQALRANDAGVWFDWGPDSQRYVPQLLQRPKLPLDMTELERLGLGRSGGSGR
jgi:hypothetical protein